jgi:hypothetical protein
MALAEADRLWESARGDDDDDGNLVVAEPEPGTIIPFPPRK